MSYVPSNRRMVINFQQKPPQNIYDIWLSFNLHQDSNGSNVKDSSIQNNYDLIFKVFYDGEWRPVSGISIDQEFIINALNNKINLVNNPTAGHIPVFSNNPEDPCDQLVDGGDINSIIQQYLNLHRATEERIGGIKAATQVKPDDPNNFVEIKFLYDPTDPNNDDKLYLSIQELIVKINEYIGSGGTFSIPLMTSIVRGGAKADAVPINWDSNKYIPVKIRSANEKMYINGDDVVSVLEYIIEESGGLYNAGIGISIDNEDRTIAINTNGASDGQFLQAKKDNNNQWYITWASVAAANEYTAGTGLNLVDHQFSLKSAATDEIGGVKADYLSPHADVWKVYCLKDNEDSDFLVVSCGQIINQIFNGESPLIQAGKGIEIVQSLSTDPHIIRIAGTETPSNYGKYLYLDALGNVKWVSTSAYATLSILDHSSLNRYVIRGIGDYSNPEDYLLDANGQWNTFKPRVGIEIDFPSGRGRASSIYTLNGQVASLPPYVIPINERFTAFVPHLAHVDDPNNWGKFLRLNKLGTDIDWVDISTTYNTLGYSYYDVSHGPYVVKGGGNKGEFLGYDGKWAVPVGTTYPFLQSSDHSPNTEYVIKGISTAYAGNEAGYFLNALGNWVPLTSGSTYTEGEGIDITSNEISIEKATTLAMGGIRADVHSADTDMVFFESKLGNSVLTDHLNNFQNPYRLYTGVSIKTIIEAIGTDISGLFENSNTIGVISGDNAISFGLLGATSSNAGKVLKLADAPWSSGSVINWTDPQNLYPHLDSTHHAQGTWYVIQGIGTNGKEDQYFLNGLGEWSTINIDLTSYATQSWVIEQIAASQGRYITSNATGSSFATHAALTGASDYYYAGATVSTLNEGDYAIVDVDEDHNNNISRYVYDGSQWAYQYSISLNVTGAASTIISNNLTTGRALVSDSNGKVAVSDITATELSYLDDATGNIQTQLNGKQPTITGAATTITSSDLTANRALISNSSGKVAVSSVTDEELGYLSGAISNIQDQIDGLLTTIPKATTSALGGIKSDQYPAPVNSDAFKPIEIKFFPAAHTYPDRLCVDAKDVINKINEYNFYIWQNSSTNPYVRGYNGITHTVQSDGIYLGLQNMSPSNSGKFIRANSSGDGISYASGMLVPIPDDQGADRGLYLKVNNNDEPIWAAAPGYPPVFSLNTDGLVPGPTQTVGKRFLRDDATWQEINEGVTYNDFAGSVHGLVPEAPATNSDKPKKCLNGNGDWIIPQGNILQGDSIEIADYSTLVIDSEGYTWTLYDTSEEEPVVDDTYRILLNNYYEVDVEEKVERIDVVVKNQSNNKIHMNPVYIRLNVNGSSGVKLTGTTFEYIHSSGSINQSEKDFTIPQGNYLIVIQFGIIKIDTIYSHVYTPEVDNGENEGE